MKIEQAAISLVPRSATNCLDMAVMFFGRHLKSLLGLCLAFVVPTGALVYGLSYWYEIDVRIALAVVLLATSPLGVLLICGASQSAFGETFTSGLWKALQPTTLFGVLASGCLLRGLLVIGAGLCLFPVNPGLVLSGFLIGLIGVWAALRFGFRAEQTCLARLDDVPQQHRTDTLIRQEAGDLAFRAGAIVLFCLGLWLVMFVTADVLSQLLFGWPILLGRVFAGDGATFAGRYLVELIVHDPRVLTAMSVTALPIYAVGRLAWFFCYIDIRVRRDCWDMELQLSREANRLQGAA